MSEGGSGGDRENEREGGKGREGEEKGGKKIAREKG